MVSNNFAQSAIAAVWIQPGLKLVEFHRLDADLFLFSVSLSTAFVYFI